MAKKKYADSIVSACIRRALNLSKNLFIKRSPLDLKFLISRWSVELHTFVTIWGAFCPTLEDVVMLTSLTLLGEAKTVMMIGSSEPILDDGDEARLIILNEALSDSKVKDKSTYTTWINYLTEGVGAKTKVVLETMLAFYLSWYILPSGPEDGIYPYVFPLAVKLVNSEQLALAPIFLRSLFYQLEECVQNQLKLMGRHTMVSYANFAFLQLFLWGRFKSLAPQPV